MICKNCGTEIPDHSRFCLFCGCRIMISEAPAPGGPEVVSAAEPDIPAPAAEPAFLDAAALSDITVTETAEAPAPDVTVTGTAEAPEPDMTVTEAAEAPEPDITVTETAEAPAPDVTVTGTSETSEPDITVTETVEAPAPDVTVTGTAEAPESEVTGAEPTEAVAPAAYQGIPTFRYTITVPPVPLGLQRQTNVRLFSRNIKEQMEALQEDYDRRKAEQYSEE